MYQKPSVCGFSGDPVPVPLLVGEGFELLFWDAELDLPHERALLVMLTVLGCDLHRAVCLLHYDVIT